MKLNLGDAHTNFKDMKTNVGGIETNFEDIRIWNLRVPCDRSLRELSNALRIVSTELIPYHFAHFKF